MNETKQIKIVLQILKHESCIDLLSSLDNSEIPTSCQECPLSTLQCPLNERNTEVPFSGRNGSAVRAAREYIRRLI